MPKKIAEVEEVKVTYQVWVLGYAGDEDCSITDYNEFLAEFATEDEAVGYADSLTLAEVKEKLEALGSDIPEDVRYLHLQVETVEDDGEYEENVDTDMKQTLTYMKRNRRRDSMPKKDGKHITLYACDFKQDVWKEYCDIAGVPHDSTRIWVGFYQEHIWYEENGKYHKG